MSGTWKADAREAAEKRFEACPHSNLVAIGTAIPLELGSKLLSLRCADCSFGFGITFTTPRKYGEPTKALVYRDYQDE